MRRSLLSLSVSLAFFGVLGSSARETLRTVDTVILDEIHAVAGTKRGVHLALPLERLSDLTAGRGEPQRVGLSATQRPLEEIAAQVRASHGPSGSNVDYVLRLAEALREHQASDEHVEALARLLTAAG